LRPSYFFAALGALAVGIHAGGPRLFALLAYDRSSILRGEVWRLLTTYLVHAGIGHLVWNLGGTVIVCVAVAPALRARVWLAVGLWVGLAASVGVLVLRPEVRVMAGLSALLHGLLAAGATVELRRGERLAGLLLVVLAAKVAWEQLAGATLFGLAPPERIAIHAHAYGAVAGLFAGLVLPRSAAPAGCAPDRPGKNAP
jgi:rhomboid family GlyGly-CTERM serine protease